MVSQRHFVKSACCVPLLPMLNWVDFSPLCIGNVDIINFAFLAIHHSTRFYLHICYYALFKNKHRVAFFYCRVYLVAIMNISMLLCLKYSSTYFSHLEVFRVRIVLLRILRASWLLLPQPASTAVHNTYAWQVMA